MRLVLNRANMIGLAATPILAVIAIVGWWMFLVAQEREQDARHRLGHSFLIRSAVAEADNRHPDSALFAALSIGFEGFGKPEDLKAPEWIPYVSPESYPDLAEEIREKIRSMPGFRPIWTAQSDLPVSSLQISANGRYLLVSGDGKSQRWDFAASPPSVSRHETTAITFSHDGRSLIMRGTNGVVLVDDEVTSPLTTETTIALASSPCGTQVTGVRPDSTLFRIKPNEGIIGNAGGEVATLRGSPDGSLLAVFLKNGTHRLFFADSLEEHLLDGFPGSGSTSVAFHPKSTSIAIGFSDGRIETRTLHDGRILTSMSSSAASSSTINALVFSPDGSRIASSHDDGLVRLWNLDQVPPVLEASLNGHGTSVSQVAFFPCGQLIASGDEEGSLIIWSLDSASAQRDLFGLIENGWYRFEPGTGNLEVDRGEGFHDLPDDSLVAAWQNDDPVRIGNLLVEIAPYLASLLGAEGEALLQSSKSTIEAAIDSGHLSRARVEAKRIQSLPPELAPPFNSPQAGNSFINGNGEEMVWCPSGTFTMGSDDGPSFALSHQVKLTSGFWMATQEVTRANYRAVVGSDVIDESNPKHPVTEVSWFEAAAYCQALTARDRIHGILPAGWRYDLPTEAQWEYACRAGSKSMWSFGDDSSQLHRFGNYNDVSGGFDDFADQHHEDGHRFTAPVGEFNANPWRLFDMHGNVFEWCRDAMDPANPAYPEEAVTDPFRNEGHLRVTRGGSFDAMALECRSSYRDASHPRLPAPNLGFRIVLIAEPN